MGLYIKLTASYYLFEIQCPWYRVKTSIFFQGALLHLSSFFSLPILIFKINVEEMIWSLSLKNIKQLVKYALSLYEMSDWLMKAKNK